MPDNPLLRKLGTYGFVFALLLSVLSGIEAIIPPKAGLSMPGVDIKLTSLISLAVLIVGLVLAFYNITQEDEINFLVSITVLLLLVTAAMVIANTVRVGALLDKVDSLTKEKPEPVTAVVSTGQPLRTYDVFPGVRISTILSNLGILLGPAATVIALRRLFRTIIK